MKPIYYLHPGPVESRIDGEFHWISAQDLAGLYRLPAGTWATWRDEPGASWRDYVHLYPRGDGRYEETALELERERGEQDGRG